MLLCSTDTVYIFVNGEGKLWPIKQNSDKGAKKQLESLENQNFFKKFYKIIRKYKYFSNNFFSSRSLKLIGKKKEKRNKKRGVKKIVKNE